MRPRAWPVAPRPGASAAKRAGHDRAARGVRHVLDGRGEKGKATGFRPAGRLSSPPERFRAFSITKKPGRASRKERAPRIFPRSPQTRSEPGGTRRSDRSAHPGGNPAPHSLPLPFRQPPARCPGAPPASAPLRARQHRHPLSPVGRREQPEWAESRIQKAQPAPHPSLLLSGRVAERAPTIPRTSAFLPRSQQTQRQGMSSLLSRTVG